MNRRPQILVAAVAATTMIALGAGGALLYDDPPVPDIAAPGPVDLGFAQDMSVHHAQAVQMADIVADNPDPAIVALAERIRRAQLVEIGRMQGYLSLWDEPRLPAGRPMAWMLPHQGHGGHGAMTNATPSTAMPGMATQRQLQRLRALTGEEQAVLFLQLMLRHHQGGVEMADFAADRAVLPEVQALAERMSFEQTQEIQVIGQLLLSRGVDPRQRPN